MIRWAGLARAMVIALFAAPIPRVAPLAGQHPPLWGGLKPGPHVVGYRRTVMAMGTLHVWFPARRERGERLRVGGYFEGGDRSPLPARLLDVPTAAFPDAVPAGGPWPLALYAGDPDLAAPDNTVLAEYLASHGYAVAAVPRADGGMEAALAAMRGWSFVSRDAVAVVARGSGWISAIEFTARCPAVKAILALDPPPGAPDAVVPGRSVLVLRLRPAAARGSHPPTEPTGVTVTVPRSTALSFGDRAAYVDFLNQPDAAAPDHRRLIGGVTHAFLDGALRAWGPSLDDLVARLGRAGLSVAGQGAVRR